jgi:hypothetical protein
MQPGIPALILSTLLATSALAQQGVGIGRTNTSNLPGDAVLPAGAINITAITTLGFGDDGTGLDDIHGVARLPNGRYIVSQGQNGGLITKQYFELDSDGSFIGAVGQPFLNGANGDIGLTDLAWDQDASASSRIWAGRAKGIMSYDWTAGQFDNIVAGANGLHILDTFTGAEVRTAAVAWIDNPLTTTVVDPVQTFVSSDNITGDPDTSNINYHRMGLPLPNFPKLKPDTPNVNGALGIADLGKLGAAYDPNSETIWWHVDTHANNPNPNQSATRFIEMDLDGNLTGKVVQGDRSIGGIARGCEIYVDSNGNSVVAYVVSYTSNPDLSPLAIPADNDLLVEMYIGFAFGNSCGGDISYLNEPFIGSGDFTVTLSNGGSNPLNAAILFRGASDPNGFQVPGINNCPLYVSLANFRNLGAQGLVNGEASYVQNLPDDSNLIGLEAAYQWLLPSNVNVLPLDLSDAGAIRVGTNL